jgi:hypothetical protein
MPEPPWQGGLPTHTLPRITRPLCAWSERRMHSTDTRCAQRLKPSAENSAASSSTRLPLLRPWRRHIGASA